jgi:DNA-binding transcriptional LysR family regulator
MVRFTLRQCEYLVAVAGHGGIAQAARALNIAQPSIAQGVAKLEAQTGIRLFERHHAKGVSLTPQGRAFLREAEALLTRAHQAELAASALAREVTGELRFGCFLTLAAFYLPGLVRAYRAAFPRFQIDPREMSLEGIGEALADGSLDMALTYDIGNRLAGLSQTKLAALSPCVLLPASHGLARRTVLSLADLANEPYVMFNAPGSTEYFSGLLADAGISPSISYAASSIEAVRTAVANGLGFSIVAQIPKGRRSYDGKPLKTVPISGRLAPLNVVIVARDGFASSAAARRFTDLCRDYFAALSG